MKKLIVLLFSFFLLSSFSVFAQEDLSKININNLQRLSNSQLINAFSDTKTFGYYNKDLYGLDITFEQINYANGDSEHVNSLYKETGKWKTNDNKMCFKITKSTVRVPEKMFTCIFVYTGQQVDKYYLYLPGLGIYAKITSTIMLIE
jgi:hypothetical protein